MKQNTEPCGLDEVCARLEDTQYALGIFDELLARDGLLPASKNRAEQAVRFAGQIPSLLALLSVIRRDFRATLEELSARFPQA